MPPSGKQCLKAQHGQRRVQWLLTRHKWNTMKVAVPHDVLLFLSLLEMLQLTSCALSTRPT